MYNLSNIDIHDDYYYLRGVYNDYSRYRYVKRSYRRGKRCQNYISEALTYKELKNTEDAKRFYEMAHDELKHASYLYDMANMKYSSIDDSTLTDDLKDYIHRLKSEYTDNLIKVKTACLMYEGKI